MTIAVRVGLRKADMRQQHSISLGYTMNPKYSPAVKLCATTCPFLLLATTVTKCYGIGGIYLQSYCLMAMGICASDIPGTK